MGKKSSKVKKPPSEEPASRTESTGPKTPVLQPGREYKLVVLGEGGVGKTAITTRFVKGKFVVKYDPTIEDAYRRDYTVDGVELAMELIDTAGQEDYSSGLHDKFIRQGEGFLCVYSITSKGSLEKIQEEIYDKILWTKDAKSVPMVLAGNKCDLVNDREVSTEDGQKVADQFGCPFFETSAKTNTNINALFERLVWEIAKEEAGQG